MTNGNGGDNVIGIRTVYDAVLRLEATVDGIEDRIGERVEQVDRRIESVMLKQERLEGRLEAGFGMIRWLGPAGVVALFLGLARTTGLI